MQDVCTERSQSWGLKNLFLPVSPMRLLCSSPMHLLPEALYVFLQPARLNKNTTFTKWAPPPSRHQPCSLKGSGRRGLFQPRDSLPRGIQAAPVGGERGNPEQRDQSEKRLWKGRAWGSRWFLPAGHFVDKDYRATQSATHEPANGKAFPVGPVKMPIPSSYTISLRLFS